jgi:oxygen-independent coproporphyrinogen-3 oxidase
MPRNDDLKPLGLYIHVPFCRSKCEYCDFYSLGGVRNKDRMDEYLQAVIRHLREAGARAADYEVDTVYFGGGTPSFFGSGNLIRILNEIYKRFNVSGRAEITLEANPDSVTQHSLSRLLRAGFNRISLGIQSDDDALLKAIGRPHTFAQAREAVEAARRAGFDNISIDLIYGLPGQTREQWAGTLRSAMDLRPEHISCYGLKVEPGTPLYTYQDKVDLPDDDTQADMYLYTVATLEEFGFRQYEISNFAREGFHSRHNLKYWTGRDYLGFGPSAASCMENKRFTYVRDLDAYCDGVLHGGAITSECEDLSLRDRAGEYLMLRLRTAAGVRGSVYTRNFRMSFAPLEALLREYADHGLAVQKDDGSWRLTPEGFLLSNQIIGALLEAQERLERL